MPSWTTVLCHGNDTVFCTIHKKHAKQTQPYMICSVTTAVQDSHFNALCTRHNQNWCYSLQSYYQMCLDLTTHTLQFSCSLSHFIMPQVSCNTWAIRGFPLNFRWVSVTSVKLIQQFSNHKLVGNKKAITQPAALPPVQYMRLTWRGVRMMWLNTAAKDTNFLCAAIHIKECP